MRKATKAALKTHDPHNSACIHHFINGIYRYNRLVRGIPLVSGKIPENDEAQLSAEADSDALDSSYAKPKRRSPVKSNKRKSMFTPDGQSEWTPYERWIRLALEMYMEYREVVKPILNPDGATPALDAFGRPRVDPAEVEMHGIKKGAVWFNRTTLRQAWFEVFGQQAYRDDNPRYAARAVEDNVVHAATNHPMDSLVHRMRADGRLMTKEDKKNRFMISKEHCALVGMPEAWDVHVARGKRWEGLRYEETQRPVEEVSKSRRARNTEVTHVITRRAITTIEGKHSPAFMEWESLRTDHLHRYLLFDRHTLAQLAISQTAIIDVVDPSDNRIDTHITRWARAGKIERILPRLYHAPKPFKDWMVKKDQFARPMLPEPRDWITDWIMLFGQRQAENPDAFFTTREIVQHYGDLVYQDDPWAVEHIPEKFGMGTVGVRLGEYAKLGHVINVGTREKRLSPELGEFFKPMIMRKRVRR